MKLFSYLALSLLSVTALAAKKSKGDRFQQFHSLSLSSTAPLKLNDDSYNKLTQAPRDYSVFVLLTAMNPRVGCQLCREFGPEWEILGKSWIKGDKAGASRLVFGTLDFGDGENTFRTLKLQTAPVLLLFPPTIGPNAKADSPTRFDFTSSSVSADAVHTWLTKRMPDGPKPPVKRPFNYVKAGVITIGTLGAITLFTVAAPYLLPILQSRNLWAALSIIAVLLFTSGHMYNHIRKVPYIASDGKGGVAAFASGFQNQFGLETQIMAAVYGILSFATVSLAIKVPRMTDPKSQQAAVIIWGVVMFGTYSLLLMTFRTKNGGYPFWLPPF